MKRVFSVLSWIECLILFSVISVMNLGAINTGFDTETLPKELKDKILDNTGYTLIDIEPDRESICCFDVNKNGLIALGMDFSFGSSKMVLVYSGEGEFQYGISFETPGSWGVEWDEDNLVLCLVRSSVAVSIDRYGNPIDAVSIINHSVSNNDYWNKKVFSNERTNGSLTYRLINNLGPYSYIMPSYSKLTVDDGNETKTLYDVSQKSLTRALFWTFVVAVFVVVAIISIRKSMIKLRNSKNDGNT